MKNNMSAFLKFMCLLVIILIAIFVFVFKFSLEQAGDKSTPRINVISFLDNDTYSYSLTCSDNEFAWRDALAKQINGNIEKTIKYGRIDVETGSEAIEVEFLKKWHEGLGQSIHYAYATHKQGVLAIIIVNPDNNDRKKIDYIKKICNQVKIKLIVLTNVKQ